VTPSRVSTARQTIMLRDIDHIACRRPLLRVMAPVAIGVGLVALRFADLLAALELAVLIAVPASLTIAASEIGVLRLSSLSLRDQAIWGPHRHLQKARAAIEAALAVKPDTKTTSRPTVATPGETDVP
jgi:hypothetical protein